MGNENLASRILATIPKNSVGRYDLLPITKDTQLFTEIIKYMASPFRGKADFVASPEAIGWIIGVAVARELNIGFIPIRKSEKLPYKADYIIRMNYIDYSKKKKAMEISCNYIESGSKVLLVDEWVETGASVRCCIELLNYVGSEVVGIATIGVDYREETKDWIDSGFLHFIGRDM